MILTDAEVKTIANKVVDKWLEKQVDKDKDKTTKEDVIAILIGASIGLVLSYLTTHSKLERVIKILEEKTK